MDWKKGPMKLKRPMQFPNTKMIYIKIEVALLFNAVLMLLITHNKNIINIQSGIMLVRLKMRTDNKTHRII